MDWESGARNLPVWAIEQMPPPVLAHWLATRVEELDAQAG